MAAAKPQWMVDPFVDPVSLVRRDKERPARRQKPVNFNQTPGRGGGGAGQVPLNIESVGGGQEIYIKPEGNSGEPHKIKSIRSVGDGEKILQDVSAEEIKLRTIKAGDDTPIQVDEDGDSITVKGNGFDANIRINSGGNIVIKDGLVESASEGVLGGTGTLSINPCPDTSGNSQPTVILEWDNGQVISDPGEAGTDFDVGECQTQTPGP